MIIGLFQVALLSYIIVMNTKRKLSLGIVLVFLYGMLACVPIVHTRHAAKFKNCTADSLFIGLSYYNTIDSVFTLLYPSYNTSATNRNDTSGIFLWKKVVIERLDYVSPDSTCRTDREILFHDNDTSYLFLIKCKDAKNHTWDEICKNKLYHRLVITKNILGKFDTNIKY